MLLAHVKSAHARLRFDKVVLLGADEANRGNEHNGLAVKRKASGYRSLEYMIVVLYLAALDVALASY